MKNSLLSYGSLQVGQDHNVLLLNISLVGINMILIIRPRGPNALLIQNCSAILLFTY